MKISLVWAVAPLLLAGCVTMTPEESGVRSLSLSAPVPATCRDLGPVNGPLAANPFSATTPQENEIRRQVVERGGDTLKYTSAFPLRGEAYKCAS